MPRAPLHRALSVSLTRCERVQLKGSGGWEIQPVGTCMAYPKCGCLGGILELGPLQKLQDVCRLPTGNGRRGSGSDSKQSRDVLPFII